MGTWNWQKELKENEYLGPIQSKIIERLNDPKYNKFDLDSSFINKYSKQKAPFGFNGFGELVYMRTYSRIKEDGFNEKWHETVGRVVNGTYNLQKRWVQGRGLNWDDHKAQVSAQEMYDRIFHMKFLPPGRGIWAMGSEVTEERGLYAALNNCAFTSTENLKEELAKPFQFLMDMSMLGVGVGFDTKGAGSVYVKGPDLRRPNENFNIPDSREGWVESVGRLINSHLLGIAPMQFDYSNLRAKGELIGGFGGKSSGPAPLKELHENLETVLRGEAGRPISARAIVDLQNMIGQCVVAGNVRRTAEIALGEPNDESFMDLKNYEINPEREAYGWTSNNSILAKIGMDYREIAERIKQNGEPGLIWLENIQKFGRMADPANNKDHRARGVNPCVEQSLEPYELCNLVETFPNNHSSLEDFKRTLKFAYLYAKTVTLGETHWPETNRVLLRNRRIGNSMSGIQQFIAKEGLENFKKWSEQGHEEIQKWDEIYSDWMTVPKSIKTTSIKPSGTVSSVAGATPGMHWPISEYYIRRMRISKQSGLINPLKEAGIPIQNDTYDKSSLVVEFPVHVGKGMRSEEDVSMWEQLNIVSFLQKYWADNQVSATIKFNPDLNIKEKNDLILLKGKSKKTKKDLERMLFLEIKNANSEADQIEPALNHFQYSLKGISMLPKEDGVYEQPPFEAITREEYLERSKNISPINFGDIKNEKAEADKFCSNDKCEQEMELESIGNSKNQASSDNGKVKLFTSEGCEACEEVKEKLIARGIKYQEILTKDDGLKEFQRFYKDNKNSIERNGDAIGFPILSINSEVHQGLERIIESLH
ncbi:fused protease/ribonucleoside-triphosphate reductase [archaeon]|jgi:ribonucleoside-triphosphate reductase (thioredoxin)|nr:fused protease/ribonucleoside-triphosphate reductase [archaeon]